MSTSSGPAASGPPVARARRAAGAGGAARAARCASLPGPGSRPRADPRGRVLVERPSPGRRARRTARPSRRRRRGSRPGRTCRRRTPRPGRRPARSARPPGPRSSRPGRRRTARGCRGRRPRRRAGWSPRGRGRARRRAGRGWRRRGGERYVVRVGQVDQQGALGAGVVHGRQPRVEPGRAAAVRRSSSRVSASSARSPTRMLPVSSQSASQVASSPGDRAGVRGHHRRTER